tara:strand:+ start:1034 stop:1270 length:237 start_codon:yes stop_codon:yes gene_type:complete
MTDYYLKITTINSRGKKHTQDLVSPLNHIQGVFNIDQAEKYIKSHYVRGVLQQFKGNIQVFVNDKEVLFMNFWGNGAK